MSTFTNNDLYALYEEHKKTQNIHFSLGLSMFEELSPTTILSFVNRINIISSIVSRLGS